MPWHVLGERRGVPSPPRLLDRVRDAIRTRHYSRRTEEAYVHWIRRYIVFHQTHPSEMGVVEISRFLTFPAVERRVSASVARKYPSGATEWRWQFVFPAARICRNPRWGSPSRYHVHESVIQKAVARAARNCTDSRFGRGF
jgi:hypothetical protein